MNYRNHWEAFYRQTYLTGEAKALWDVPPEQAVERDLPLFRDHFEKGIPVLDLGCGTGGQSLALARQFPRVIGVDVSEKALSLASSRTSGEHPAFFLLDITDRAGCRRLSEEWGDVNIYLRGVLHQFGAAHLSLAIGHLSLLMGRTGAVFLVEVADGIRDYFGTQVPDFHRLPPPVQRVFVSHLPPKGLSLDKFSRLFPSGKFRLLRSGTTGLATNLRFADGSPVEIPAVFAVLRNG
ncbi:MAG: hypothetical protein RLY31_1940 [Bacteroidota bacterium]|jgi:SAM-dependent methyltransferase